MVSKEMSNKALAGAKNAIRRLSVCKDSDTGKISPDLECGSDGSVRQRLPKYVPKDWDDSLPYGGKVYLARKKKRQPLWQIGMHVLLVLGALYAIYFVSCQSGDLHYHVTKIYAHMGHAQAQAAMGHKFLHGHGVEKNHTEAINWLHEAAQQGHPHASYNLAIAHMQGIDTRLEIGFEFWGNFSLLAKYTRIIDELGEAKKYIKHAADNGVQEAIDTYRKLCVIGKCDI